MLASSSGKNITSLEIFWGEKLYKNKQNEKPLDVQGLFFYQ
jgi:hypothetical protein